MEYFIVGVITGLIVVLIVVAILICVRIKNIRDDIELLTQTMLYDILPNTDETRSYAFKNYMAAKLDIKKRYNINLDKFCDEYIVAYKKKAAENQESEDNRNEEDGKWNGEW